MDIGQPTDLLRRKAKGRWHVILTLLVVAALITAASLLVLRSRSSAELSDVLECIWRIGAIILVLGGWTWWYCTEPRRESVALRNAVVPDRDADAPNGTVEPRPRAEGPAPDDDSAVFECSEIFPRQWRQHLTQMKSAIGCYMNRVDFSVHNTLEARVFGKSGWGRLGKFLAELREEGAATAVASFHTGKTPTRAWQGFKLEFTLTDDPITVTLVRNDHLPLRAWAEIFQSIVDQLGPIEGVTLVG